MVDGQVMIIDEFTGRILEGRRWSEGLHQAVEAKEGVAIGEENQTLATITLQNYFRLYDKLSGMTGTALTEATEFMKIYKVPVVEIPTNQPMVRADHNDQIFKTKDGKWKAVLEEIIARHEKGQPILVGTVSVEVSEMISGELKRRGVEHAVLNAKPEHAQTRGRADRRSRSQGRGDDRHQHGRPRRRHQARRRPRAHGAQRAEEAGPEPGRRGLRGGAGRQDRRAGAAVQGRGRGGARARRPLHLRHRAARIAPHRQPAARPLRPPGRPRRDALLPLRRRRRDPPLRRRPHLQNPRSPRPGGRGGRRDAARGENADQNGRGRAEEGRGAELPDPQTGARVRRRDERAAPRRLQIPPRDPRGPRHVGHRPRRAGGRDRAPGRRVHARRRTRRVGHAGHGAAAAPDLAGERRGRLRWRPRRSIAKSSKTPSTKTR